MVYIKSFLPLDRARYFEKLSRNGSDCPYGIFDWPNDTTEWPEVSLGDTFYYLIESPVKGQLYYKPIRDGL